MADNGDNGPSYVIRMSDRADAEIDTIYLSKMRFGLDYATRWLDGINNEIAKLAEMPRRYPRYSSEASDREVRRMSVGRGRDVYFVLYAIIEGDAMHESLIRVLHVRHSSREPEQN